MTDNIIIIARYYACPIIVFFKFRFTDGLFIAGWVNPGEGQAHDDGVECRCKQFELADFAQRDGNSDTEHQLAENALVVGFHETFGHAPAVRRGCEQNCFWIDIVAKLFFDEAGKPIFEGISQAGAIHNGGFLCAVCNPRHVVIAEEFASKFCAKIATAHAKGINGTIHFGK